ncbi:MAG TPA: hypothetical protein VM432_13400 [Bdellovibrionales bacterium]|nr:hypothetical protein [Bdellovibrionales bacterium]
MLSNRMQTLDLFAQEMSDGSVLPRLHVDQAFFSHDLERAIFVKYDVDLDHRFFKGKRANIDGGTVIHGETVSGHSFAMLIHGFSPLEVDEVERSANDALGSIRRESALIKVLLPRACASDAMCTGRSGMSALFSKVVQSVGKNDVVESIMSCGLSGFERLGSSLKEEKDAIVKFFKDPAGAFHDTLDQFRAIKNVVLNLNTEMAKLIKMVHFDPALLKQIACSVGGELLPKILFSALTGGGGTAKLLLNVGTLLPKLGRLASLFEALSLGGKVPNFAKAVENILNGRLSESVLGSVDKLIHAGKFNAAAGVLNCAK